MSFRRAGLSLALILAGGLWSAAQAAPVSPSQTQPGATDLFPIEKAQSFYRGGYRYCFYWDGWHGPGWYRCGFEWRRNYGWGGAPGRQGWAHPPRGHKPPPHKGHPLPPPKKGFPPPHKKGPPPPPPKKGPPPPFKNGPPSKKGP